MPRKIHLFAPVFADVAYVLQDEFSTTLAAGSVDATDCEPGPGTRNVTDVETLIEIASGRLQLPAQATAAWGEESVYLDELTRAFGQVLISHSQLSAAPANGVIIGLGEGVGVSFGDVDNGAINFSTDINYWNGAANIVVGGAVPTGQDLFIALVLRAAGCFLFLRQGNGYYELLWHDTVGNDAAVRPKWVNHSGASYSSFVRAPLAKMYPKPEAYDTFTRGDGAIGSSETSGPDSQALAAKTYVADLGTVQVNTNKAIATVLDVAETRAIATLECDSIDVVFDLDITNGTSVAGHILRYIDANNYLLTYIVAGEFRLAKRVLGFESNVIKENAVYGAGKTGRVIADGTTFHLYYDGVYLNSGVCADAILQNSTKHGVLFADLDSTVDALCIFPRGSSGEYNRLANFNPPSGLTIADLPDTEAIGKYEGENPIIPCGEAADSDQHIREIGNVLYEPTDTGYEYKTWYTGWNTGAGLDEKIHYAYSSDGITWTKSASNPVIDARTAEDPYVVKVGATYYLYAEDKEAADPSTDIRYWTSPDGEAWADQGGIIGVTNCASPVVWKEGATWYMLYENYPVGNLEINLATSADGATWVDEGTNPVMAITDNIWGATKIVPDDVVKIGITYYMFYHGYGPDTVWKTAMATSTDLTTWVDNPTNPIMPDSLTASPTTQVYFDTEYVFHYYYDTDLSGILRGYPCAFAL